jgi:non-ribosomal peptide synthetase component F
MVACRGLLACSARKVFGVEDQHAVAFRLDPATVGESAERLVRRLPGRANELSNLLLRQVVGHSQRVAFTGAELLCQQQQLLGDPSGDVGEDLISHSVVGAPQPTGQQP